MVEVVIPEGVETKSALLGRTKQLGFLRFIFADQNYRSLPRSFPRSLHNLGQDIWFGVVVDILCCIQPQPVQVILTNPVRRILPKVLADWPAVLAVEVNPLPPIRPMRFGKIK